jgi:hypothetical protein
MLTRLWARDVEPFDKPLELDLGSRLNLLCGDNGLGKTFVLDLAWYLMTNTWAGRSALPKLGEMSTPRCGGTLATKGQLRPEERAFDFNTQHWGVLSGWEPPALVIYVDASGGFDVLDPYRRFGHLAPMFGYSSLGPSNKVSLRSSDLWEGLRGGEGVVLCDGLLRDWVNWQSRRPQLFEIFLKVLAVLSPHSKEILQPGPVRRVSLEDVREVPTLKLRYGDVPVTHASSGMRRVLALAYVLVWTWHEHQEAARLRNTSPLGDLVLLIDEVDAHLHPQWQRVVLPALFQAVSAIEPSLRVQLIASTHAPLVLASVETIFDESTDKLWHFALDESGKIKVEELPWAKQGDATNWLVSESFGLKQARSRKAEDAIEAAEAFLRGEPKPAPLDTREAIDAELRGVLAGHDEFWPRWLVETGAIK